MGDGGFEMSESYLYCMEDTCREAAICRILRLSFKDKQWKAKLEAPKLVVANGVPQTINVARIARCSASHHSSGRRKQIRWRYTCISLSILATSSQTPLFYSQSTLGITCR
jgi:hypothetical protein